MATDTSELLAQLIAGQTDLRHGQAEIIATLGMQGQVLRLITERLCILLGKLTPEVGEGPTLQEMLAELVTRVGDNGALLRRIDRRTESMAMALPDDIVRAMKAASGVNMHGAARHDANGGARS